MSPTSLRRALHAATASVLLLVPLASWPVCRTVLLWGALVAVALEGVRVTVPQVGRLLSAAVPVYRDVEARRPSGAMWLAVGYALAALFSPPASVAGIAVGATADPAASWVGGTVKTAARKTARGSAAHLLVACVVLLALTIPWPVALVAATVGTLFERWAPLDDNLLVPPGVAAAVALLS